MLLGEIASCVGSVSSVSAQQQAEACGMLNEVCRVSMSSCQLMMTDLPVQGGAVVGLQPQFLPGGIEHHGIPQQQQGHACLQAQLGQSAPHGAGGRSRGSQQSISKPACKQACRLSRVAGRMCPPLSSSGRHRCAAKYSAASGPHMGPHAMLYEEWKAVAFYARLGQPTGTA